MGLPIRLSFHSKSLSPRRLLCDPTRRADVPTQSRAGFIYTSSSFNIIPKCNIEKAPVSNYHFQGARISQENHNFFYDFTIHLLNISYIAIIIQLMYGFLAIVIDCVRCPAAD